MPRDKLRDRVKKDDLARLYLRDGLSTLQIADRFHSNRESVRKLLLAHGIELRSTGAGKR